MSFRLIKNTMGIGKYITEEIVTEGDIVLDCTVGNGHDTLRLAKLVGDTGKVYGFDIQEKALENTKYKLEKENLMDRVELIKSGHEFIDDYIDREIDFIIYNLGYLPGGDKNLITKKTTTVESIKKSLKLLKSGGFLIVISYIGHEGGKEEQSGVFELLESLDQRKYNVLEFNFINQINNPPKLYFVEKSRK